MSCSGFPTWSNTNLAEQPQKMARGLKCLIYEVHVEQFYYLCSKNKGIDQLCCYCAFVFAFAKCQLLHAYSRVVNRLCSFVQVWLYFFIIFILLLHMKFILLLIFVNIALAICCTDS